LGYLLGRPLKTLPVSTQKKKWGGTKRVPEGIGTERVWGLRFDSREGALAIGNSGIPEGTGIQAKGGTVSLFGMIPEGGGGPGQDSWVRGKKKAWGRKNGV